MKNRRIYENLDTSFVNFTALLRHLRDRGFNGRVCFEAQNYKAEIFLLENNRVQVREYDCAAGRVAKDQEALQRILLRAREPGGIVHVFQTFEEIKAESGNVLEMAAANQNVPLNSNNQDLPNRSEAKFKTAAFSPEDWQTLLNLTVEMLGTIDKTLAEANLNFTPAFKKACAETSFDYPFLNPAAEIFQYWDGRLTVREPVNPKIFVAGICEALRRILEKLGAKPQFSEVHRTAVQKILALVHRRRMLYDKFQITPQLEKILGVQ